MTRGRPLGELLPGDPERIGSYLIRARIGAGGMGIVYLAEAPNGQPVAIKVIQSGLTSDPSFRNRFKREVAAAQRVRSRVTVAVLDADAEAEMPWIAFEYVEGPNLEEVVAAGLPRLSATIGILTGIAEALVAIHQVGIIHRDLKPSNILCPPDGVKVIDFGIAAPYDPSGLTGTALIGTPAWLSPEQISGQPLTPAVDVFAWGCVALYITTGRLAFGGGDVTTASLFYKIAYSDPDLTGVPDVLVEPVTAAMAKNPEDRPEISDILRMMMPGRTLPPRDPFSPAAGPSGLPDPGVSDGAGLAAGVPVGAATPTPPPPSLGVPTVVTGDGWPSPQPPSLQPPLPQPQLSPTSEPALEAIQPSLPGQFPQPPQLPPPPQFPQGQFPPPPQFPQGQFPTPPPPIPVGGQLPPPGQSGPMAPAEPSGPLFQPRHPGGPAPAPIGPPIQGWAPPTSAPISPPPSWPGGSPPPGGTPPMGPQFAGPTVPAPGWQPPPPGWVPPGGPGGPPGQAPKKSHKGLVIGIPVGIVAIIVILGIIGAVAGPSTHSAVTTSPATSVTGPTATTTPTTTPGGTVSPPAGVTPLAQLLPSDVDPTADCDTNTSPPSLTGLTTALVCNPGNLSDGQVFAFQFDNSADYTKSLASLNMFKGFDSSSAGTTCPPGSDDQDSTGWNNDVYPSRDDQVLECLSVGKNNSQPDYIWTYPSENAIMDAQAATGSSFADLDTWWTKDAPPP